MIGRRSWILLVGLLLAGLLFGGCSLAAVEGPSAAPDLDVSPTRTPPPTATLVAPEEPPSESLSTQTDSQGSVTFEITPITLSASAEVLEFEVVMNTHSVDLGWDLAAQGVLRTEDGREVAGSSWPVGSGHHYSATLTFPSRAADGAPLMEGATRLTLILRDTDVPERQFTWEVDP